MYLVAEAVGGMRAVLCRFIPVSDNKAGQAAGGGPAGVGALAAFVMDALEQRQLLSCSLSGTVVTCNGTSNADGIIVYQVNGMSENHVWVEINGSDPDWDYVTTSITRIDINAGAGADVVLVGRTGSLQQGQHPVSVPLQILGEDGDDTLEGGDLQGDTIRGDDGDDDLFGFGGADLMWGGYGGADSLEGGAGNDTMYGGYGDGETGADTLKGDGGNDSMFGQEGNDSLEGGLGADWMYGGSGNDTLRDAAGADSLFGEDGDDIFWLNDDSTDTANGGDGNDSVLSSNVSDVLQNMEG